MGSCLCLVVHSGRGCLSLLTVQYTSLLEMKGWSTFIACCASRELFRLAALAAGKLAHVHVCSGVHAGHWKLGHTLKNLVVVQAQMLFNFALFAAVRNANGLFSSFGFTKEKPAFIAYTLFSIISAPLGEVTCNKPACWLLRLICCL